MAIVSASAIIANMSRGWNRDPVGVAVGARSNSLSGALWTHDQDSVLEVWADPDPSHHVLSIPQITFSTEMFLDGRLAWAKPARAQTCTIVPSGQVPRAVNLSRFVVLHLYVPQSLIAVTAEELDRRPGEVEILDPACSHDGIIERIGRDVLAEMRDGQPLSRLRVDALGLDLAIQLLRRWSSVAGSPAAGLGRAKGGLAPWQLRRATAFMEDELAKT